MLGEARGDVDIESLRADLRRSIGQFRVDSFSDIELGPMLDGMIEIARRHGIRLPASLAMTGKAFGQMQLAVAELDPDARPVLERSAVHVQRHARTDLRGALDPQQAVYEGQKLKLRVARLIEGIERHHRRAARAPGSRSSCAGAGRSRTRSGAQGGGSRSHSRAGRRCSRRCSPRRRTSIDLWVPITLGVAAGIAGLALVLDLSEDASAARARPPFEHDREQSPSARR